MSEAEKIYRKLQIHLDNETVGFPATESGSDIRLLKSLFTPEQAKVALYLTFRAEPLDVIYERANKGEISIEDTGRILNQTRKRGMIGSIQKNNKDTYFLIPYIVGMGEAGAMNPTPEFIKASGEWSTESGFWGDYMKAKLSQMRTIPIEESLTPEHNVGSYDDLKSLIESSKGPFAIFECVCRKGAEARGEPCKKTSRKETCFAMGPQVIAGGDNENFHIISKAEALEILRMNEEDGLVLQPATAVNPHFICSCCGDCCGMLRLQKAVPKPTDFWFSNYYAEVDSDLCSGCGTCVDRCQVDAMTLDEEIGISNVNLDRCIGCGNCVPTCPDEAITLIKKDKGEDLVPPADYAEMIEIIMTDKKSKKT